jgi:hypothetical protein
MTSRIQKQKIIESLIEKLNNQALYNLMRIFESFSVKFKKTNKHYLINLGVCSDKCIDNVYSYLVCQMFIEFAIQKL